MGDAHKVVVDYVCEMVGREAVVLEDYLVVDNGVVEDNLSMHEVLPNALALGNTHANDVGLAEGLLFLDLVLAVRDGAKPVVFGFGILLAPNLDSHLLKAVCRAETWISVALFEQLLDELVVDWQTF